MTLIEKDANKEWEKERAAIEAKEAQARRLESIKRDERNAKDLERTRKEVERLANARLPSMLKWEAMDCFAKYNLAISLCVGPQSVTEAIRRRETIC